MPKRPLSNVSNNYQAAPSQQQANGGLKRGIELIENAPNSSGSKRTKSTQDSDQENEKGSMFKKLLNHRLIENITKSNLKASIYKQQPKKDEKVLTSKANKQLFFADQPNPTKDQDQVLIETLNKNLLAKQRKNERIDFTDPLNYYEPPRGLPADVEDYDRRNIDDINAEPQFAYDIFEYYFAKEKQFRIPDYIDEQPEITRSMRAILVDWIVELQDTLALDHETIYLSVKIVDHYLSKAPCTKVTFQLLGSTAVLVAAKYGSRLCPQISSFLYVCDNAYKKEEIIEMERQILSTIDFNLGMPLSYRFLRRYARCAGLSMETLTFARYILEMCLLEYDFVRELDSMMAAACLLLVFKSKKELNLKWTKALEFYTHYREADLLELMHRINKFMQAPMRQSLKTIREKYSSSVYFKVAANRLLPISEGPSGPKQK